MAYTTWDASYSVGIDEIDRQHKKLFGMINDYFEAAKRHEHQEGLKKLLAGLSEYVLTHFRYEEKYFSEFSYGEAEAHRRKHRELTDRLSDLLNRHDEGKLILATEIGTFMREWLVEHVRNTDTRYAGCFQENWDRTKTSV